VNGRKRKGLLAKFERAIEERKRKISNGRELSEAGGSSG
jgi:hypothetical protein